MFQFDSVVESARSECAKFLAGCPYKTADDAASAMAPMLRGVKLVVASIHLATGDLAHLKDGAGIQISRQNTKIANGLTRHTSLYFHDSGRFVRMNVFTCDEGCHVLSQDSVDYGITEILKSGVDPKQICAGFQAFLKDVPNSFIHHTRARS